MRSEAKRLINPQFMWKLKLEIEVEADAEVAAEIEVEAEVGAAYRAHFHCGRPSL